MTDYTDLTPHAERCDMAMADHDARIVALEQKCADMQQQLTEMGQALRTMWDVIGTKPNVQGDWHLNE